MDLNIFWQQLGLRKNLNNADIQYALAVVAVEYVEQKEQITEYKDFKDIC